MPKSATRPRRGQIDRRAFKQLYQKPLPTPTDVLNLIDFAQRERYRWYAMLIVPLIYGLGGSVRWAARWKSSLHGERQAEELLVVRYPNHRRFLMMTANPYYAVINKLREQGVARFEASFCHPTVEVGKLQRCRQLLVAHFNEKPKTDSLAAISRVLEPLGGELVYAAHEVSTFSFLRFLKPSDPNPLTFKQVAFFRFGQSNRPHLTAAQIKKIAGHTQGLSLQIYQQEAPDKLVPGPVARLMKLIRR